MIPASLQIPAALVLLAGGLLACFAGYRLFRIVLAIYGFVLGALVASSIPGTSDPTMTVVWLVVGGLIGAAIFVLAYFVGVALVGAALGALIVHVGAAQIGTEPSALVVIVFAVCGAFGAMALQRHVIIVATALGGAWTAMLAATRFIGGGQAGDARSPTWLVYPTNPELKRPVLIAAWIALATLGIIVQLWLTGRKKKTT